jgi:superoxide dismutase
MSEIVRLNLGRDIKDEALSLLWNIKAHECFFNSFCHNQQANQIGKLSKEKFLYDLYTEALGRDYGFLFIFKDRHGNPRMNFSREYDGAFIKYEPALALDLYEHTYFLDYGFDKKRFLKNVVMYLDLSSLDNRE